jgi:hypothetical protein
MEIVENWSRIIGTVRECQPPEDPTGPGVVAVCVDDVGKVIERGRSYPNFLNESVGEIVRVQVPNVEARDLHLVQGMHIELEVRRGRSAARLFARPGTITVRR